MNLRDHLTAALEAARTEATALEAEKRPFYLLRHRFLTLKGIVSRLERTIREIDALDEPERGPVPIREAYSVGKRGM